MPKKKLLIITNVDWFLISHRLVIAKAAASAGWQVFVACEDTGRGSEINVEGIEFVPFSLSRSGTNPIVEYKLYNRFRKLYRKIKPDVVHQITIKPVVYGSLAAKREKIPGIVNAISGLGYMFTQGKVGVLQKLILFLMKNGVSRKNVAFIFQNGEDQDVLIKNRVIDKRNSVHLIKGSGVDLEAFRFSQLPPLDKIRILLPCRMLWDKGIKELKEASDILKAKYKEKIEFVLVGLADDANKSGVSESYLYDWEDEGYVRWDGQQSNMVKYFQECHIVVLPSYREGLPKTLIEACAIGRPIITTDAIGCRDCVEDGFNGIKVPVRNAKALAEAIEHLVNNKELMEQMGINGRVKAENEFDVHAVIEKHLNIYKDVLVR